MSDEESSCKRIKLDKEGSGLEENVEIVEEEKPSRCPFKNSLELLVREEEEAKNLENALKSDKNYNTNGETSEHDHDSKINSQEMILNGHNQNHDNDSNQEASDDLRHFDVLDDLERHPDQDGSDSDTDSTDSMDSDVPDEEIEAMLEEGVYHISRLCSFKLYYLGAYM